MKWQERALALAALAVLSPGCTRPSNLDIQVTGTAEEAIVGYSIVDEVFPPTALGLPWSASGRAKTGDMVSVFAQISKGDGNITVAVYKNSALVASDTATGLTKVASIKITLP